jgi:hypothetical protein
MPDVKEKAKKPPHDANLLKSTYVVNVPYDSL